MRSFIFAMGITLALTGASLAQSSAQGQVPASKQNTATVQQQVKQNLAAAGFSDIQVMPESFLVRANDKNGNPVMMIINPDSLTAVTAIGGPNGTNMAASGPIELNSQQKQKIRQIVANQAAEQAPSSFQLNVGATVPDSLTLKSFPSSARTQLPASVQGAQFAKLTNKDIIVVDPSSRVVVAVINQSGSK